MDFRLYWRIVTKRFWLVLALVSAVLLSYALFRPASRTTYVASMRFVVGVRPETGSQDYYRYDRYYSWLTAEYLVDDLAEVVKSRAFAGDVASAAGVSVPVGVIQGATAAGKLHRVLSVSVTWGDAETLQRIANAVADTLRTRGHTYFGQLGTDEAVVSLIDPPAVAAIGPSLRQRLDLPLRLVLALAAGIALAFLADYVDDSVRGSAELAAMGVAILGEVPRHRWRLVRRRAP